MTWGKLARARARRIGAVMAGTTALLGGMAPVTPVTAQGAPASKQPAQGAVTFAIPAQPLASAIVVFSAASGLNIVSAGIIPPSARTAGVSGALLPRQALAKLLAGTGYTYRFTGATSVTIVDPNSNDAGATIEGAIPLDTIEVSGASGVGFQGTPDWVYEQPKAVSVITRDAIDAKPPRNIGDLVRDTAGVYAETDRRTPGTTINIRGLQSQGRVTTTLDEARQTFRKVFGPQGPLDRAFISSDLLRGVEIEKSHATGVGGAGALSGVVNFRTLDVDDVLLPDRDNGMLFNGTLGSNGQDFHGSAAVAGRTGAGFEFIAALAHKSFGEYKPGTKGIEDMIAYGNSLSEIIGSGEPGNSTLASQDEWSGLVKARIRPAEDHEITLSYVGLKTDFDISYFVQSDSESSSANKINNNTYAIDYKWTPDNNMFNLSSKLYYNQVKNDVYYPVRREGLFDEYCPCDVDVDVATFGGFLANKSKISVTDVNLSANYGIEFFRDGLSSAETDEAGRNPGNRWYKLQDPNGDRLVASAFADFSFKPVDWLDIQPGLRYDYWRISGTGEQLFINTSNPLYSLYKSMGMPSFLLFGSNSWQDFDIEQSGGEVLPSATVLVEPFSGLQVYGKYTEGYRPPQAQEMLFSGIHVGDAVPTISLRRFMPNPGLEPEESRSFEIGVNGKFDGILRQGDALRFKASAFDTTVDNYVTVAAVLFPGDVATSASAILGGTSFVNLNDEVRLKGLGLEANYDMQVAYIGGSYSYLDTRFTSLDYDVYWRGGGNNSAYTHTIGDFFFPLMVPPKHKFTIDGGVRLLDRKLTLGGRMQFTGETLPVEGFGLSITSPSYEKTARAMPEYTTYDLYGVYKHNENVAWSFSAENITDVAYGDTMSSGLLLAPGRTFSSSMKLHF